MVRKFNALNEDAGGVWPALWRRLVLVANIVIGDWCGGAVKFLALWWANKDSQSEGTAKLRPAINYDPNWPARRCMSRRLLRQWMPHMSTRMRGLLLICRSDGRGRGHRLRLCVFASELKANSLWSTTKRAIISSSSSSNFFLLGVLRTTTIAWIPWGFDNINPTFINGELCPYLWVPTTQKQNFISINKTLDINGRYNH